MCPAQICGVVDHLGGQKLNLLGCSCVREYLGSADEEHPAGSANEFS